MHRGWRILAAAVFCGAGIMARAARAAGPDVPEDKSWAFSYDDHGFKPGSETDLRSLNEDVAGQHGYIRLSSDGESFVRGDGQPIRFWAVNADWTLQGEDLEKHARFLASLGVNMIRIHSQVPTWKEGDPITAVDPKMIDTIWHAVAAFKKNGIYVTISPYWAVNKVPASWGLDGADGNSACGLLFFNSKLQDAYKEWVKQLYTPKNPYTGIPLAQDPAVGIIQVQNEDGMFFWTMQGLRPAQQTILGRQFSAWLAKKYGTLDKATARWAGAAVNGDDFANNQVGIMPTFAVIGDNTGGTAIRVADQNEFFADTQRTFYADISKYYHDVLGCHQIINASNWITANNIKLNDAERYTYTATDVVAVNHYYTGIHNSPRNGSGWRIDPGDTYTDPTATLDIRNLPCNFKQVVGHPFMVTESSWVNPMSHQTEGPLLMAAYQSLTGMNMYYWFACSSPEYDTDSYFNFLNFPGGHPAFKWTCTKPEIMGMFPAAALIYRKGYIQQGAQPAIHEERALSDIWAEKPPLIAEDASFDPNRFAGRSGSEESNIKGGINPLAFLVGRVEVKYGGIPANSTAVDFSKYIDSDHKIIHSITGQITMDYGNGLCTVNAPSAVEATGALAKGGRMQLGAVTLESGNDYGSVAVVPLDDAPIASSAKLLVQVGTWGRPTGWTTMPWKLKGGVDGIRISATGHMPERLINTDVTIAVHDTHLTKAVQLDTAGYPGKTLDSKVDGGVLMITLPPDAMYVVLE
jgi:hypothetical protein